MQKTSEEFKQFADKRLEEYLNYEKQLKAEYEAFKKEIMDKWGDRTMVESSQKKWVEYGEDKDSRTTVDFEKGKVTVEVLADPTDDDKQIEKKLEKAVSGLINSKGKTVDFDSKVIPNKPLSNEPLLKDQIDFSKYSSLNLKKKNQPKNDSKKKEESMTKAQTKEIPKAVVKDMIRNHSAVYSVDEPLIYAIMEQESSFNPAAKSFVPAYGLMQLVPKSGGRDAYNFVHKQDIIPSADYLYNPENNIQLGTGYLQLLMTRYFAGVKDPQCRMLCAIAAYNTGAGNVSRAFTGNTNINKAIPHINKLTYDQLYEHLKSKLPHAETRDYVQKVTSKMEKYKK